MGDGEEKERREANIDSMDPENDFLLPLLSASASAPAECHHRRRSPFLFLHYPLGFFVLAVTSICLIIMMLQSLKVRPLLPNILEPFHPPLICIWRLDYLPNFILSSLVTSYMPSPLFT